jgi:hypothetical protein
MVMVMVMDEAPDTKVGTVLIRRWRSRCVRCRKRES